MFYCWHQYQSLTVSSVVGAPWRCGVLTTQGGIAGIGLDRCSGESMLQLPRVGWRLLASENGAPPDCIIIVVVVVVVVWLCVLLWLHRAVLCVCFLALKTTLCVHSKRSRVYFQNTPVCAVKTTVSYVTSVLKVHTGASRADCLSVCLSAHLLSNLSHSLLISLSFSLFLLSALSFSQ